MNKCDCCGKFGELEDVTIIIKKHKQCDVNSLFSQPVNHVMPARSFTQEMLVPGHVVDPVIQDMSPIATKEQELAARLARGEKLSTT